MNRIKYSEKTKTLTGVYNESVNARAIHKQVIAILNRNQDNNTITALADVARGTAKRLMSPIPITNEDCVSALHSAFKALTPIDTISQYTKDSSDILSKMDVTKGPLKVMYMEIYLQILRKYISVSVWYSPDTPKPSGVCEECGAANESDEEVCGQCGNLPRKFVSPTSYIDAQVIVPVDGKDLNDIKSNFWKKYLRYQGRCTQIPPKEVFDTITKYFKEHGVTVIHSDKYRAKNIDLMYKALSAIGCAKYNNDINVVCHHVWGWPLPDLRHLDDRIDAEFDEAQLIIEENKGNRKSDVINGWRLWRQLLQAGYERDPNEFRIPRTGDIVKTYENLWYTVCTRLGWKMKIVLCDIDQNSQ